jgi:hypothetical protein
MVGGVLLYIIMVSVMAYFIRKDNKSNKEFWDKYFKLLERKSKLIYRDIEAGKIEAQFHSGEMILIDTDKNNQIIII